MSDTKIKYMLDTNIIIYAINERCETILNKIADYNQNEIGISSIVYSELMFGAEKSSYPEKNKMALYFFLSPFSIIDYDYKAAQEYGVVKAQLKKEGTPIGPLDTLIAAHAKSLNTTLITNNTKEFKRVENLKLENWYQIN